MNEVSDTDRAILSALRHNARASLSDLASQLGISRTTLRSRIEKLERSGEILGYSVVVKSDAARDPVRALMMIGIEGRGSDRIMRQISGLGAVRALHSTNGRWDLIAELGTQSLEDLDRVLFQIRRFDGVAQSETSLLLSTRRAAAPAARAPSGQAP